jgi:hypothetical protein
MTLFRLCSAFAIATVMVAACGDDPSGVAVPNDGGAPKDSSTPPVITDAGNTTDSNPPPAETFSIGGTVTGLLGTGLVLQNNAGDDIPIAANGAFTFPKKVTKGAAFAVTIKTQPSAPKQTCSVSAGTGTVVSGNVTSVVVNCASDKFTVGGTITGLVGSGLTLQNNAGDDLIVNANGTFAFPTTIASGKPYAVTVKTQPGTPSQTCAITAGTGTVAAANVTNVAIVCTTNKYTVGGTVSGLTGTGLTLQVNGGDSLPVAASGAFTFPTAIDSRANYTVTVSAQPTGPAQTCTVSGGTGTVGGSNVTSVTVNCATNKYTIGGTASGLLGSAVLQNNGGDNLTVSANGSFSFAMPIDSGAAYAVTIATQPGVPSQTCTLADATGNVAAADITNVALTCVTNTFKVKGTVSGLAGTGLIVQNSAGDDLPIAADGSFEFVTPVTSGQTYAVTVSGQPSGLSQTCTVANGNGTMGGADVTNVAVTCTTNSYTVGGAVAGLTGTGLVLQNNLGDDLPVAPGATAFTFPTSVVSGGAYSVSVKTQPADPTQTCTVAAGAGTVTNGNVVSVMVNCTTNSYAIAGTVSGLAGTGLKLQNNSGDDITINGNGDFSFPTPIASGATYLVTPLTQPTNPSQSCIVTNGSGTVGGGNVTNVTVTCTTNTYTVGGTVTGLTGTLVLRNNGGNDLSITQNGSFTFSTPIASGATYAVTRFSNPTGQYCTVASGSGTVTSSNVTSVAVTCASFPMPACTADKDPGSGATWTICAADANSAWISGTNGKYHPELICQSLGYHGGYNGTGVVRYGGTCGTICGYCQSGKSCTNLGNRTFDIGNWNGSGNCGSDSLGPIACNTVHWECAN